MPILQLQTTNFRNLKNEKLDFSPGCNLFYGNNGSGKTSILEAIYFLGMGKSFRTHLMRRIINYKAKDFALFGKVRKGSQNVSVGVERSIENSRKVRIAGEDVGSVVELVKLLPMYLLNQNCYDLFVAGPKARRHFLDWGVFHVEPSFLLLWKKFDRVLEQRNAAIRNGFKKEQISLWDHEFSRLANELNGYRVNYLVKITPVIKALTKKMLGDVDVDITYRYGWACDAALLDVLRDNIDLDVKNGYTSFGPHRADIIFKIDSIPIQDRFSRGQQKLFTYALQLAQGIFFHETTGVSPLYLIDDITAELDADKQGLLVESLLGLSAQLFVTGLSVGSLNNLFKCNEAPMFHVEHGKTY